MKKFAVFDIDGTLVRWQLYHAVVDKLAQKELLGSDAQQKIHEARMTWKNRETKNGFQAYEVELIQQYEKALTQLSTEKFDAVVKEVAEEYKDQVYAYTRDLILELKQQGYFLLAISGSQKEPVAEIVAHYGFDDYVATDYHRLGQTFSGEVNFPAHDKKAALNQLVEKHKLTFEGSYAIGDSKSDAAMLAMVKNPIAFNPDHELFEIANRNDWLVVIERKNMVYELEKQNGQYVLVQTGN